MKDIEAFAELGEHFDYLVKTYSSGMFVCLAFSTFIFLEQRLVDETLSVGDFFSSYWHARRCGSRRLISA